MADEGQLREALRSHWNARKHGELIWQEAAHGGTDGAPDVWVPLGVKRGYCPLELKWWEVRKDKLIAMTARPAQKRFHFLAWKAKQRTAYLAELSSGDYVMIPGWVLQLEDLPGLLAARVWTRFVQLDLVRETLLDEKFWKGMK